MINDIVKIVDALRDGYFYGGGEHIEIAKGKNEIVTDWKSIKEKIKRRIKR